jgi:hypothetical protein
MNCCDATGTCTQGDDCPVRVTHIQPPTRTTPVYAQMRKRPCGELGMCNCPPGQCGFDMPELGPATPAERALICVLGFISTVVMLIGLGYLYGAFGHDIGAWVLNLVLTTAALVN